MLALDVRDRLGRGLLVLLAVSSLAAFGAATAASAAPDRLIVETWRTAGFLVFAGLFAVLAARPRTSPALWELVVVHKLAVGLVALAHLDVPEAAGVSGVDLALAALTGLSWVLCRGWRSWRRPVGPARDGRGLVGGGPTTGRLPDGGGGYD